MFLKSIGQASSLLSPDHISVDSDMRLSGILANKFLQICELIGAGSSGGCCCHRGEGSGGDREPSGG